MKEQLQLVWNQMKQKEKQFKEELASQGYYLHQDQIKENKKVLGLFWEITYLDESLGDGIYLCHYYKGASLISGEIEQELQAEGLSALEQLLTKEALLPDEVMERITELEEEGTVILKEENGSVSLKAELDCEYDEDEEEENVVDTFVDDSRIQIREVWMSEIDQVVHEHRHDTYNT